MKLYCVKANLTPNPIINNKHPAMPIYGVETANS